MTTITALLVLISSAGITIEVTIPERSTITYEASYSASGGLDGGVA